MARTGSQINMQSCENNKICLFKTKQNNNQLTNKTDKQASLAATKQGEV